MRRSTQMLLLGVAVFVVGAGIVFVALSGKGGSSDGKTDPATTPSTLAAGIVTPAGTDGSSSTVTVPIPKGKQAVAVQVPFVSGLAGYARAGDLVNVYATVEKGQPNTDARPPVAKLVLAGVEVLAVTGPGPGSGTGNTTYLLAVNADQAEQAIFFARFESLWMTLVPKGQPPASTPGHSYQNAF